MKKVTNIRIGTRGSALALWQANYISKSLSKLGVKSEIIIIKTLGDKLIRGALSQNRNRGKSFFVKEIEDALLNYEIDIAVHSLKDVPPDMPDGLILAAVAKREDPSDAYISRKGNFLDHEKRKSIIGTSSPRRIAQLKHFYPEFSFMTLRGNVETRIRKMHELKLDGIVLAYAGVKRLGRKEEITKKIPISVILPAAGQGAIAVECRKKDRKVISILKELNDRRTSIAVEVERRVLTKLEGGCQVPVGVLARWHQDTLLVSAVIASLDGKEYLKEKSVMNQNNWKKKCDDLAELLLNRGGRAILKSIRK